jgi:hypothetical protein
MHAVIRRYRVRLGTVATAAQLAQTHLVPHMSRIPGFAAYYLLDAGEGIVASISICGTKDGADLAAKLAADWFRSDWPSFQLIPPEVTDGEVLVHAEVIRASGRRHSERRNSTDQRSGAERRVAGERRAATIPVDAERRSGLERRAEGDRRMAIDRRVSWQPAEGVEPRSSRRLGVAPPWRRGARIG